MCGIAGFLDFDKASDNPGRILRLMLDSICHRGPDDRGEELIANVDGPTLHLGHQRFSIIDLTPGGHQPMPTDDQSLWISTNSEIYNFRELREELSDNFRFNSQSDTEVLLKAFEHWGLDCLEKLRGMFAFAVWDSKKQQLILARDRLGIKPLYYISTEKQFLFASEVRSLLASGHSDKSINPTGLYHYLSFGHLKSPESLIGNIQELQPGHYLIAEKDGSFNETKYWNPLDSVDAGENDGESIQNILQDAVEYRQVSDVPIGAFLSGGIDSSAIVSHMARTSDEPITTLTLGFKEKEFDESEHSAEISRLFKTRHRLLTLDEEQLLKALPDAISAMDQPTMDGINTFLISRAAHEAGLKVVLSGLGGDELFGGYPSFQLVPKLLERKKWLKLYSRFLLNFGSKILKGSLPFDQGIKLEHWLNGKLSGAHEYYLIRALYCQDQVSELFQDQTLADMETLRNFEATNSTLENLSSAKVNDDFNLVSYLETTHYLQNMLLRDADMMSMAHPLEVRVPFMDHKLVEYMFISMPTSLKKLTLTPKALLVDSMKPPLPDSIVHRKKMGFTLPFEPWMRGAMKSEMESVLLTNVKPLEGLISQAAVEKIWQQFLAEKISWSRPWALYVLKRWVDKNLS